MIQRQAFGLTKPRAFHLVLLTALGAALVAACGGDGSSDTSGTGGADPGSGGSATGSGGSPTGSGGSASGGASGGAVGSGGGANPSGGAASTGGAGGLGGNGPGPGPGEECPETMPGPEDACQGGFNSPTCTYGEQECECQGFGPNATWECGEPGEEPECPDEAPADDAPCTEQQFCNFGQGNFCICDGENWNCP